MSRDGAAYVIYLSIFDLQPIICAEEQVPLLELMLLHISLYTNR